MTFISSTDSRHSLSDIGKIKVGRLVDLKKISVPYTDYFRLNPVSIVPVKSFTGSATRYISKTVFSFSKKDK